MIKKEVGKLLLGYLYSLLHCTTLLLSTQKVSRYRSHFSHRINDSIYNKVSDLWRITDVGTIDTDINTPIKSLNVRESIIYRLY